MKHAPLMILTGLALMACSPSDNSTAPMASSETATATPQSEPAPPASSAPTTPAPGDADTCNMAQYSTLVGKPATDPAVPAAGPTVRLIRPGTQVTQDFLPTRLDIDIDDKGVITAIRCG